jgi:NAD(P)H-hydrate repair Nnr-like enzyme with NAD(P)H-hydrate epimerase domain
MKYLLSTEQMRELDRRTIKECNLSSRILMETAGKGCADLLVREFPAQMENGILFFAEMEIMGVMEQYLLAGYIIMVM